MLASLYHLPRAEAAGRIQEVLRLVGLEHKADEVARNVFAHPTLTEAIKESVHGIAGHMINL